VKRGLTVAVAGAAIVVAGISGCSSNKSSTGASSGASAATSAGGGGTPSVSVGGGGAAAPTVIIDGKNQNITGQVVCTTVSGNTTIAIGGAATGISAVLTTDNPPQVKSVGLGNVNGVTLAYAAGSGQGNASATKDGSSYKITGTATGVDMANPMQPVKKPFEIDVTCS
jgi:ipoprotein LpqH